MAAEHMVVEEKKGGVGGAMDFKNMDLGELMKDFDPAMLQELLAEEMKDPALQEMVSAKRYLWMDSLSFRKLRLSYALCCVNCCYCCRQNKTTNICHDVHIKIPSSLACKVQ